MKVFSFFDRLFKQKIMTLFKPEDFEAPNMWTNKIGGGGFGIVFKLKELKTGKYYAVKFINSSPQNYGIVLQSFLDEVDALNRLDYPTIVHFHGFTPKPISIITEFIPNGTLYDYIYKAYRGEAILEWDMCHKMIILLGISFGMEYLHQHKIMHRDLKPLNILLDLNFYPKICDFGLSKTISTSIKHTTYLGTKLYMAPEVDRKNAIYNEKADVYSFGLIMYSLLYDQELDPNFTSKNLNFEGRIISKSFEELIITCCNNNPEERSTFEMISEQLIKETMEMKEYIEEGEGKEKINEFLIYCHREIVTFPINNISQKEIEEFNVKYENDSEGYFCYKDDPKFTKLHFAAKINDTRMGLWLISKGEDINSKDIKYQNILILFLIKVI